ncbi:MAG: O-antigen ligase family protein [Erysipelotrichaceae bacterium]
MGYNKNMKNTIKKFITKENIIILATILVALYPILELDYLAYDFLNSLGIPRLTTIMKFIVLPLLGLCIFLAFEKNKKRAFIGSGIYAMIFIIYFILHVQVADGLQYSLRLTSNFVFRISDEVIYFVTLLIPLIYVWLFQMMDITERILKKVVLVSSMATALPIFLSNIFIFGMSTYEGYTIDSIFSWFSLPFNEELNHPRYYASKFFFEEGNTIGVLLIMVLPLLYYFFLKAEKRKEKLGIAGLIIIHSLAMIVLGTRIATYGAMLVPAVILAAYFVLILLKKEVFKKAFIVFSVVMIVSTNLILPYTPAYQNQLLDARDYGFIKLDSQSLAEAEDDRKGGEDLEAFSEEWINFYVFMFETYSYLIGVTPPVYYTEWYDYRHDPKFWVDLALDYELEERVNGRQVQQIFTDYKYDQLTSYEKVMGMGYSTFMNGSIVLEKDFAQQFYTLGYIGFALVMAPWLVLVAGLGILLVVGYKKGSWNLLNVLLMMSLLVGLLSSYTSGHVMDEMSTSLFIGLCLGVLVKRVRNEYGK